MKRKPPPEYRCSTGRALCIAPFLKNHVDTDTPSSGRPDTFRRTPHLSC